MKKCKWLIAGVLTVLLMSACSTTDQAVNESSPSYSLQNLTSAQAERLLIRGRTQQHQVQQWFGQPNGLSKSGPHTYWNYTYSYHEQDTGQSGLVILTVVFDDNLLVIDYDLQSNRYRQRN